MRDADVSTPIIPGFHPDPSICRVGDDYYVATSSFEYVPGVPIHHSRDLSAWTLVGHALDAAAVNAAPGAAGASSGIYAPTLRHHDGQFFLITTSIADMDRGHLITRASDPAGPWTAPVYVDGAVGIDPDLAWDASGTCYLTWADPRVDIIFQATVDPVAGRLLEEPYELTRGSGYADPEAPHLYKRDGWWHMLLAEGGTSIAHRITAFRSRSPRGPFEPHPDGPILSHGGLDEVVQATGHGDLVQRADGSWAMVYLGIRRRGAFPGFHTNGRETFARRIEWRDDWPVVTDEGVPTVPARGWVDDFSGPGLDLRWVAPGVPPASFAAVSGYGLALAQSRTADAREALAPLCTRAVAERWAATVRPGSGDVALSVRIDANHWYGVERVGGAVRARVVIGPADSVLESLDWEPGDELSIRTTPVTAKRTFRTGPDEVALGVVRDGDFVALATVDGRYLSTEAASGFTGRMIALEALNGPATVRRMQLDPQTP